MVQRITRRAVWIVTCAVFALVNFSAPVRADDPAGTKIEAESVIGSDSRVIDDAGASGGKAVTNAKAWQPLAVVPTPAEGDAFILHLRHRGGPLLLKALVNGKQKEFKQVWAKPADWKWTSVGKISRAQLGDKLYIVRGAGEKAPALDAVILSPIAARGGAAAAVVAGAGVVAAGVAADAPALPDDAAAANTTKALPPDKPDSAIAARSIDVTITWEKTVAKAPAMLWGVADYEVHSPASAADPGFVAFMKDLHAPLIRVHQGNFPKQYLDAEQKHFDVEKMKACWDGAAPGYGNAKVMMNISTWPKWMCVPGSSRLAEEHLDDFAAMCVDLLKTMRDPVGRRIDYWEILNERDEIYDKANRLDDLWPIYNRVVAAMRAEDPKAKFGGPAFTWANPKWVESFLLNCIEYTDFVSYHNYGVGNATDSNEMLMSRLDSVEEHARYMRRTVDEAAPDRHVEVFLTEYNVKWTWEPMERRHANSVGAVFQAGVVARAALAGIDGAAVWHVKGNAYGILDSHNVPRLTAPLFRWGPKYLVGKVAQFANPDPQALEILPVIGTDGRRSLLVANKTAKMIELPSGRELLGDAPLLSMRVTADGVEEPSPAKTAQMTRVPGYCLVILTQRP